MSESELNQHDVRKSEAESEVGSALPTSAIELGRRIEDICGRIGWDKCADAAGKSVKQLRRYAKGDDVPISALMGIAEAGGIPLNALILGSEASGHTHTATIDEELLGKVNDAVTRVYKEMRAPIQPVALGQVVARIYNDLADAAADRAEWEGGLKVSIKHLQRELQAPVGEAGTSKRSA